MTNNVTLYIPAKGILAGIFFLVLLTFGCGAVLYKIYKPIVIEKQRVDTIQVVVKDTVFRKYYPIKESIASLITPTSKLKSKSIEKLHGYTPFELGIYMLKAHESFRPWKYPDGKYPSKGFGLNLTPDHIKWASKKLGFDCMKRNWTYQEGVRLLYLYYEDMKNEVKRKNPNLNEFQLVALLLHKYNTGNTNSINACCNAKKGCGSKNRDIRKVHNERRKIESLLFSGKITKQQIKYYHDKAIETDATYGKKYK